METILNDNLLGKPSKLMNLTPHIFCFFIFSFLGWILETAFCYCLFGEIVERGFLNSPICPIYRNWRTYSNCLFKSQ